MLRLRRPRPLMATDSLDRVRELVARLSPDEIRELASRMDPDDLAVLEQVVMDTYVVEADAFDLLGYTPNPGPQTELHRLPTYDEGGPYDVLYGGAAFGGKSYGLLHDGLAKAHQHPGLEVWLIRETYPQLYDSFIGLLEKRLNYAKALGAKWNSARHELRLPNGSILKFRHARNMKDAADMLSAECQYLIIDERTRMQPGVVDALSMRVRSGNPTVPVIGIRSGSNPGGPGHSRVKQVFIDPAPLGWERVPILSPEGNEIPLGDGRVMDAMFIPSRAADNPSGMAADPFYVARLDMLSPNMRAAYRDGDWSKFEGMRFDRFDPSVHIGLPSEWLLSDLMAYPRARGIDFGSSAPFACIWIARVRSDLAIAYRELHIAGLTPTQQAQAILAAELEGEADDMAAFIDPSTFARNPEQPQAPKSAGSAPAGSIASRYIDAGVKVRKAHNDRVNGWSLIDEQLAVTDEGETGLIILQTCPNLIRSLSGAPRSDTNPEDVDPKYTDDHAADAFRYGLMGLMGGPQRSAPTSRGTGRRAAQRTVPTGVRAR